VVSRSAAGDALIVLLADEVEPTAVVRRYSNGDTDRLTSFEMRQGGRHLDREAAPLAGRTDRGRTGRVVRRGETCSATLPEMLRW
jgi:hypothetical protein